MRYYSRLFFLNRDGKRIFGRGPQTLLRYVEETGSLRSAAARMDLSYGKALAMVRNAEEALGFPLLETRIGGAAGGGSRLSAQGRAFLERYAEWDRRVAAYAEEQYRAIFEGQEKQNEDR